MPRSPAEIVAVVIYILLVAGVVFAIIFWRQALGRWTSKMFKALPQVIAQFCIFCKAVVLRLSNLLIGGAIGLAWVFYNQFTGQPLPMNVFWSLVVVMFVCACFGAWRQQFQVIENQNLRRPDFRFQPRESLIQPRIIRSPLPHAGAAAHIRFNLCFRNLGTGVAWHPRLTVYFGWLDNLNNLIRAGGTQARGDWAHGEPFAQEFWIAGPALRIGTDHNNLPQWGWPNRAVGIFVEIESRANSELGEVIVKTQYLQWRTNSLQTLLAPSAELIESMTPHIEAMKNSLATQQPSLNPDTEGPEQQ